MNTSNKTATTEQQEGAKKVRKDLSNSDLRGANLRNKNLEGADLRGRMQGEQISRDRTWRT